jgi:hypothetical protein
VGLGPTAVVRLEGPLAHGLAPSHQLGINTSGGDRSAAGRGWPRRWGLLGRWGCSNSVTARILLCALPVHAFPVMPEAQRKGARNLNSTDPSLPRSNASLAGEGGPLTLGGRALAGVGGPRNAPPRVDQPMTNRSP